MRQILLLILLIQSSCNDAFHLLIERQETERARAKLHQRLLWNDFLLEYGDGKTFKRHLRMSITSFNKLLNLLRPVIERDETMARHGSYIRPELALYATLRFLAGGSYTDVFITLGISAASFYRIVWTVIDAIYCNMDLSIKFPKTMEELTANALAFERISYNGVFQYTVGVHDGILIALQPPSNDVVSNVRSFFPVITNDMGLTFKDAPMPTAALSTLHWPALATCPT